jgi:hypothetical protein
LLVFKRSDHTTIYSAEFLGHDVMKNPRTKSMKKEELKYEKPSVKIDGETVSMVLFRTILKT